MGRDEGGREDGPVLHPRLVQVEDPDEARHEGWQEGGLWQGGDGEGKARAEDREGFPGGRPEEERLSREPVDLVSLKPPAAPLLVGTPRMWQAVAEGWRA